MKKLWVASVAIGIGLWGMVAVPVSVGANDVSDQIAQNASVGFPTAEAAFRFDLLDGVTPPYPAYSIDPVVYSGRYAMAGWTFGEMGGVSIAEQREGFWVVICGGGGVFTTAEELQRFCGIPPQAGQPLLNAWMNALNQRQGHRVAEVYDPPSNVRLTPNGEILCSVRERRTINIYGHTGDWYYTDVCGREGVIHSSQIRF